MNEREAFLAAIAEAPANDVPRLVFADWLEEHDDPLAEFIRLQIELEPLRVRLADPPAELERVKRLHGIPPGGSERGPTWPLARMLAREEELLRLHRAAWLDPVAGLEDDNDSNFAAEFRRGFVASVEINLSTFLEHGLILRRACPALERLVVFGTLGSCEPLAGQAALAGLGELVLPGWLTPADAAALAKSPYLVSLRSLTIWLGGEREDETCRALARLPGLGELVLVQREGGLFSDDADYLGHRADTLAGLVNEERGERIARVERPFARLFPLDGLHIGHDLYAGRLPGNRPVLVVALLDRRKHYGVLHFDAEGYLVREDVLYLGDKLVKSPPHSWQDVDEEELIEVLSREIGFEPGPIFVHEFESQQGWTDLRDSYDPRPSPDEDENRGQYWRWSTGQFLMDDGNYWLDRLGRVHST